VYRYRCGQCHTTSPIVGTWAELLHERDRHRRLFHGGHRPDGEQLLRRRGPRAQPGLLVLVLMLALLLLIITR
jgi:hypothetical protein